MKRALVALSGIALFAAVGCSGASEEGEAAPAPDATAGSSSTPSSGAEEELPHSGAPEVTSPLPESVLADHPCKLLDRAQVEEALGENASDGQLRDVDGLGKRCRWSSERKDAGFVVGYYTEDRQGLSAAYANSQPQMDIFREAGPIEGFPAVAFKKSEDDLICTVVTGISDEYAVGTTVTIGMENEEEGVDSCEIGERVATEVIGNLKAKA